MTFQLIRCQTFDPFNKVSFEKILKEIRDKVDTAVRLRGGGEVSGEDERNQQHSRNTHQELTLLEKPCWKMRRCGADRLLLHRGLDETTQQLEPVRLTKNSRTWPAEAKQEVKHKHDASVVLMINASENMDAYWLMT